MYSGLAHTITTKCQPFDVHWCHMRLWAQL